MNPFIRVVFVAFSLLFLACDREVKPDLITLQVADHQVDCTGVGPQKCLLIKQEGETKWSNFYQSIEGFTFESGYEYKLRVRREKVRNPPADGSSLRYILVEVIEKTKP